VNPLGGRLFVFNRKQIVDFGFSVEHQHKLQCIKAKQLYGHHWPPRVIDRTGRLMLTQQLSFIN